MRGKNQSKAEFLRISSFFCSLVAVILFSFFFLVCGLTDFCGSFNSSVFPRGIGRKSQFPRSSFWKKNTVTTTIRLSNIVLTLWASFACKPAPKNKRKVHSLFIHTLARVFAVAQTTGNYRSAHRNSFPSFISDQRGREYRTNGNTRQTTTKLGFWRE